jgi:hypothetical protein
VLGPGIQAIIATAYAEMHVKIAKWNHQMSVDTKVHACMYECSSDMSYSSARLDVYVAMSEDEMVE